MGRNKVCGVAHLQKTCTLLISCMPVQHYCVGDLRHPPCNDSPMREQMMNCTNESGGILKEENKKRRSARRAMNIDTPSAQPSPLTESEPSTSPMKWVPLLQMRLAAVLRIS